MFDSYTLYVVVEREADGKTTWFVLDHFESEEDAIEHANVVCGSEYDRTGIEPVRLDD